MKYDVTMRVRVEANDIPTAVAAALAGVPGQVEYLNAEPAHEWNTTEQVPVNLAEPPPMREELPPEEAPKPQRKKKAAKPEPEPEEVTREMIHDRAATLLRMKGQTYVADILAEYGATKLSLIPEDQMQQAYEQFGREVDSATN